MFSSGKVSSDTENAVLKTVPMIFSLNPKIFRLKLKETKFYFIEITSPKMFPAQLPCTFDKLVEIVSVYAQKYFARSTKNKFIYLSSKFFTSGKVSSDTQNAILKTVPMIFLLNPKMFRLMSKKTKLYFIEITSPKKFSRTIRMRF